MANFSDLPTEVRLLIVRDLPESKLFELKSFNSLLLNQWMDIKWGLVIVDLRTPDSAVRLLQRVVDPFVATRPKVLIIDLRQPPSSAELTSESFDGAVTVLLDSLPLLPNITSLDIEVFENLSFDVATFFQRITSLSFARKLQRLALSGHVGMLMSLWGCSAHNTPLESLTRLNLDLDDNMITQTEFSPSLEHFLRSLAPTLQSLHVSTAIDLSPLFDALARPLSLFQTHSPIPFPNLISLFLHLHFKTSWRDSRSLCRFLIHNNLQHLHLRIDRPSNVATKRLLGAFLTELANHSDQLPSFQTLNIYPPATQAGLSALLTLIKRSAPTLSSLLLPFRYLTDEEAIRVVDALTGGEVRAPGMTTTTRPGRLRKLKNLEMRIICLSVPFLDLLACRLPQLETLSLRIKHIIGSDQHSFYDQLERRWYDPDTTCSQDVLHAWKLQDFSIYSNRRDKTDLKRAERAVAAAVPALACRMESM